MKFDLYSLATNLQHDLQSKSITFTNEGYPIIPKKYLLTEIPDTINVLPMTHRHTTCPDKTLVCFFEDDPKLYRHLHRLEKLPELLHSYAGICGFDLSPRVGTDTISQKFNLLLSLLATAYLATEGLKVLPNFRIGSIETISVLNSYPQGSCYAVGQLGNSRGATEINEAYFRTKLAFARPNGLLIYGKLNSHYRTLLEAENINYIEVPDYRRACRAQKGV